MSPFWNQREKIEAIRFLYALKGKLRYSFASCVITCPTFLFTKDDPFLSSLFHLSDAWFSVSSFAGTAHANNSALKDYSGLFTIHKLPRFNSLVSVSSECVNLAFKCKRKRFVIEKLRLPPELSDTPSRTQEDSFSKKATSSCSSSTRKETKLDF